jgi:hypothetical protein
MNTNITIQVHVLKPSWVTHEKNRYRLFLDNDLLTERDWIWNINTYIEENIWVKLESGKPYTLKLEPLLQPNSVAKFVLNSLKINGCSEPNQRKESTELSFKTYKYSIPRENYEKHRIFKRI